MTPNGIRVFVEKLKNGPTPLNDVTAQMLSAAADRIEYLEHELRVLDDSLGSTTKDNRIKFLEAKNKLLEDTLDATSEYNVKLIKQILVSKHAAP